MSEKTRTAIQTAAIQSILILCISTPSAALADGLIPSPEPGWPQWRGIRRDGITTETGLLQTWPVGGPGLLWKVGDLGRGWSSPIVVDGRVYITGDVDKDLVVFAFDTDGKPLWRVTNGRAWKRSYPGARAACAYSAGKVYNVNAHGRVACLDAKSGKEIWSFNMLDRFDAKNITWAISECLLIDGDRLIVTPGGKKALMAAVDKTDGKTLWTTLPIKGDKTSHCSPILFEHAGRRIISNCSASCGFGVDADTGQLLWTVPLKNRYGTNISTPVYGDGMIYYVTPYAELGRAYRLIPIDDTVAAKHLWTCPMDTVTGGGVLVDKTLYTAGYKTSKWWFAIDWETGQTRYELKDLTTGSAICADNRLYCLDEKGNVALLKTTEKGFETKGRFNIPTGRYKDAWTHPVLLDGKLYIRHHETLYCYNVKAPVD